MGPVICVCTGNICRSPMAEAFLRQALKDAGVTEVEVISAGVSAYEGNPASPFAVKAMAEKGLDIAGHRSQMLTRALIDKASLILVMTSMHKVAIEEEFGKVKTPIFLWRERRPNEKQVADPWGSHYESYKIAREAIAEAVGDWVAYIKERLAK